MRTHNIRIASKRQATLPARMLEDLRIDEGDVLELTVDNGIVVGGRGLKLVPANLLTPEMLKELKKREKLLDLAEEEDINIDQLATKMFQEP